MFIYLDNHPWIWHYSSFVLYSLDVYLTYTLCVEYFLDIRLFCRDIYPFLMLYVWITRLIFDLFIVFCLLCICFVWHVSRNTHIYLTFFFFPCLLPQNCVDMRALFVLFKALFAPFLYLTGPSYLYQPSPLISSPLFSSPLLDVPLLLLTASTILYNPLTTHPPPSLFSSCLLSYTLLPFLSSTLLSYLLVSSPLVSSPPLSFPPLSSSPFVISPLHFAPLLYSTSLYSSLICSPHPYSRSFVRLVQLHRRLPSVVA